MIGSIACPGKWTAELSIIRGYLLATAEIITSINDDNVDDESGYLGYDEEELWMMIG